MTHRQTLDGWKEKEVMMRIMKRMGMRIMVRIKRIGVRMMITTMIKRIGVRMMILRRSVLFHLPIY